MSIPQSKNMTAQLFHCRIAPECKVSCCFVSCCFMRNCFMRYKNEHKLRLTPHTSNQLTHTIDRTATNYYIAYYLQRDSSVRSLIISYDVGLQCIKRNTESMTKR